MWRHYFIDKIFYKGVEGLGTIYSSVLNSSAGPKKHEGWKMLEKY